MTGRATHSVSSAPPVARARAVLIIAAPQRLADLRLQRLLDDLPHGELMTYSP
jgi:hypothetical protein